MKTPALLSRFPAPVLRRPQPEEEWPEYDQPLVPPGEEAEFPHLAADLALWRENIEPAFRRWDHEALLAQHRFWRQQVVLIIGGLLATILGALQAAAGGGNLGLGVAQAVLTGLLTGVAAVARGRRAQQGYLNHRLRAEQIKSEFFLFLGRVGDFDADDREQLLLRRVQDIVDAEGSP
jgi:hypothetical protein